MFAVGWVIGRLMRVFAQLLCRINGVSEEECLDWFEDCPIWEI